MAKTEDTQIQKVTEFAKTITIKNKKGKHLILPLSPEDNQKFAQLTVAECRGILEEWKNTHTAKDSIHELTSKHLKDFIEATKTVEEMAEKAYGLKRADDPDFSEDAKVARSAVNAVLYYKQQSDKVERAKPAETIIDADD